MKNILMICSILIFISKLSAEECSVTVCGSVTPQQAAPYGNPNNLASFYPLTDVKVNLVIYVLRDDNGNNGISSNDVNQALNLLSGTFNDWKILFNIVQQVNINSTALLDVENNSEELTLVTNYHSNNAINIYFTRSCIGGSHVDCIPTKNVFINSNGFAAAGYTALIHEMGHAMGLYHTYEESFGKEYVNRGNTGLNNYSGSYFVRGDLLSDTPAEPDKKNINFNGPTCTYYSTNGTDEAGESYSPNVYNYMSYTGECRSHFTLLQYYRMHYYLQNNLASVLFIPVTFTSIVNGTSNNNASINVNGSNVSLNTPVYFPYRSMNTEKVLLERINMDKHFQWDGNIGLNKLSNQFTAENIYNQIEEAEYRSMKNATISAQIDGFPVKVKFKDPWFVANSNGDQPNTFMEYSSPHHPTGAYNNENGGIFSNIAPNMYSIQAPNTYFGRQLFLKSWDCVKATVQDGSAFITNASFTDNGASITAQLKGQMMTGVSNTLDAAGQHRVLKDAAGNIYLVYESIGKIWLEQSTDGGTSWCQPISLIVDEGKLPSACAYGDRILFVYQKNNNGLITYQIRKYYPSGGDWIEEASYNYETTIAYSNASNPTIICSNDGLLLLAWQQAGYIKYQFFVVSQSSIAPYTATYNGGTASTSNSFSPALGLSESGMAKTFYLAFEKRTASSSNIMYRTMFVPSLGGTVQLAGYNAYSSGSGYTWNYLPSVAMYQSVVRINWLGQRVNPNSPDVIETASLLKSDNNSHIWSYGSVVSSSQINSSNNGFLLAFSQVNTIYSKDATNYSHPTFNIITSDTGSAVQVSDGRTNNQFAIISLNTSTVPYRFTSSSFSLNKTQSLEVNSGRSGVVASGLSEIYFELSDISVDGKAVSFESINDSMILNSYQQLNQKLISKAFQISPSSQLLYSVKYGVTDSVEMANVFNNSQSVKFRVDLIDANTNEVLSTQDNICYDKEHIFQYDNIAYLASLKGFGSRMVKMRLLVADNLDSAIYVVSDHIGTSSNLNKFNRQSISLINQGENLIKEYSLHQNYPNPFNPSTEIMYDIPRIGNVNLKVFDAVGREITTLVNNVQEPGRYSVNFDASMLSSGMYIYKLTSGTFSQTKRMMLVK